MNTEIRQTFPSRSTARMRPSAAETTPVAGGAVGVPEEDREEQPDGEACDESCGPGGRERNGAGDGQRCQNEKDRGGRPQVAARARREHALNR